MKSKFFYSLDVLGVYIAEASNNIPTFDSEGWREEEDAMFGILSREGW